MNLKEEAQALSPYIVKERRHFHRHGELSFHETDTTAHIAAELTKDGIEVETFDDHPGVIGTIKGAHPGRTVLLRSDIDALPIQEESGSVFASENPGVMHACGHDCHMAMLLGAAKLLAAHKADIHGTVKVFFQSGEESGYGMKYYIAHHCFDGVDAAFGMHMEPHIPKGCFSIEKGPRLASCTDFRLTVHGVSAHGSTPHLGRDAIVAASAILMNLQTLVSRRNNPLHPLVVTIGKVRAGKQFNIICDKVVLEGTIRALDRSLWKEAPVWFAEVAENTAKALGCTAEFDPYSAEPVTENRCDDLTEIARKGAVDLFGEGVLYHLPPVMASEDFSYLMEEVPSLFALVGTKEEGKPVYPLHSDHFCADDSELWRGAAIHARFAIDYLKGGKR